MEEIGMIDFQYKPWIVGTGFSKMYTTTSCFFPAIFTVRLFISFH